MIYCDISIIYIRYRGYLWISNNPTNWIPPKNPEVNQSRSYLCSTIRAGAQ